MLASILSHTPTWVRVVFAGLVVLGFRQARPRMVSRRRLIVLPLAVAGSSLYGVALASGYSRLALAAWLLAMAVAFLLMRLAPPRASLPGQATACGCPAAGCRWR